MKPTQVPQRNNQGDKDFIEDIVRALDQEHQLDYTTQLKLKQAREKALDHYASSSRTTALSDVLVMPVKRWWPMLLIPLLAMFWLLSQTPSSSEEVGLYEDIELLTTEAEPELLNELEFYQWFAEQEDVTG